MKIIQKVVAHAVMKITIFSGSLL